MAEDDDNLKPKGPPPPWIADFRRDLRAALDQAKREEDADPDHEIFDPPEGIALADVPHGVVAVFLKRPEKTPER